MHSGGPFFLERENEQMKKRNFDRRCIVRTANALLEHYRQIRKPPIDLCRRHLESHWQEIERQERRLQKAKQKSLTSANRTCQKQLHRALQRLIHDENILVTQIESALEPRQTPSLRTLYDELHTLTEEFEHYEFDLWTKTISVFTDEIILEDVNLGTFEIRLAWTKLREGQDFDYEVIAQSPNPAANSEETIHPHVESRSLCEGDGSQAIASALKQGRVCDFFLIIHQILKTYNSGSAYVQIENWSGVPCMECGDINPQQDCCDCNQCEGTLCDTCVGYCEDCQMPRCMECMTRCFECESHFCGSCVECCEECDESFCHTCLNEDLCPTCLEEKANEEENEEETINLSKSEPIQVPADQSRQETDPAIHTVCVGETVVAS